MTAAALRAGDVEVVKDYCQFLRRTPPGEILRTGFQPEKMFEPLWLRPDLDVCRETAEALFAAENSRWNPIQRIADHGHFETHQLATTPLLCVSAFRQQLMKNLADKTKAGTVSVKEEFVTVNVDTSSSGTRVSNRLDPLLPKLDEPQDIRHCDLFAQHVSVLDGAPQFELYWPTEARDQALARIQEFVEKWGARYNTATPEDHERRPGRHWQSTYAQFTLPLLKQPATAEDVKQGLAIFSLGTEHPARQVAIESFPQPAQRKTPMESPQPQEETESETEAAQQSNGFVWQAEEIQQNGQWIRYYGFVGRHSIERVPASEIELPKPDRNP